jgi:hypothetical protein
VTIHVRDLSDEHGNIPPDLLENGMVLAYQVRTRDKVYSTQKYITREEWDAADDRVRAEAVRAASYELVTYVATHLPKVAS